MKPNKTRTSITIDPMLWEKAKRHCKSSELEQISFSELVEKALIKYLEGDYE